ncbi:Coenzyme F420 hydrogenase/dehydrogenase, beta subunit C-terminal domain [Gloeobacter morelensis]|uniref:Coenzyme F420 hydrogenase/dehydrogenase, beta subunit C-terminal domain n=1 Tax=Gloeobacter morelensis MG652769 TaxID=2781736 RepID=A0ABY3PJI9_9CYAN|nr:Coenzyme F420 hydrogenase/dehydrogenase, beta subunit C-terminal domain [Gloeobacter morelensis]UFP93759.1 Coenzyme F420 hydrogenase/dehydrogenase, beta subunit C-terminal domain [Gloeobacter morelensis MG652769]
MHPKPKNRPALELCSECGLCDTSYLRYAKWACAFITQHMDELESKAHGRERDLDNERELYFGVHRQMYAARKRQPIEGAQWTGIVSTIGVRALENGLVDAVLCVGADKIDRFTPRPLLARTPEAVLAARVNKPTLSPNLSVLDEIPKLGIKRLLAIGVGCQIQALRTVQDKLGLEALYVLGTPCVDNVTRQGLQTFLDSTSRSPATVVHYEFMQDFRIHFKHEDGSIEKVPFFGLDTKALKEVFAPSCLSCFDYVNGLADLVVGYMGAQFGWQWIVERNDKGRVLLELVRSELEFTDIVESGKRFAAVQQGIEAYDKAVTLPMWAAKVMGAVIDKIGPRGLEYARFSIDSHFARNYLYVRRRYPGKFDRHIPRYAKKIVSRYRLPTN